ncbi:MAG TPA: hypothetical protein VME42_11130, partial [Steroidobacteraceae bacterium]|nr:hypothetical protein [Steroidobacteraceae bacterium]
SDAGCVEPMAQVQVDDIVLGLVQASCAGADPTIWLKSWFPPKEGCMTDINARNSHYNRLPRQGDKHGFQ